MRQRLSAITRERLLKMRIYPAPERAGVDPRSLEYLYLVQQRKRLALAQSVGRLRPRNLLLLPFIVVSVLIRLGDLWIANQTIRAMINEHDLLRRIDTSRTTSDP